MHPAHHLRSRRGLRARRGVSLLWILVALCGVALAAIVAIPAYFSDHEVTLDAACRLLARDLASLRTRAALYKVGARMEFDPDGWRAFDAAGQPVEALGESEPIQRRFSSDGVFEGVQIRDLALGAEPAIEFDARGMVREGGELVLFFGADERRVVIEPGAGHVLVYKPGTSEPFDARAAPSSTGPR